MKLQIKMDRYIVVLAVILQTSASPAQSIDTLNKYNDKGAKVGFWKTYYDSAFERVDDSLSAVHVGFEYYINGEIFRGILDKKHFPKGVIKYIPNDTIKHKNVLDGTITYYDKRNNLSFKEEFSNGVITKGHSYNFLKDNGSYMLYYEELIDFTKTYEQNKDSYYFEVNNYRIFKERWDIRKMYVLYKHKNKRRYIDIP